VTIQITIERAIHQLVSEFLDEPYRFFTEADAVARFHELLEADPILNQRVTTENGHQIPIIHQEYPTFFRFDDKNPIARLPVSSKARRGHYDLVIMNPEFISAHTAETVKNRNYKFERIEGIQPLQAVVEFKLDDLGWSNGRTKGIWAEIGKLVLSQEDVELRYLVALMRYRAPNENRWKKYWPQVEQTAQEQCDVRSLFATSWVSIEREPSVSTFGNWLSNTPKN
jgi:hypothetical protein